MALGSIDRAGASLGAPRYLGTIDCTTTAKTNAEATTPFPSSGTLAGKCLLIHNAGSVVVSIHPVTGSTDDVTTNRTGNHGVPISPGERVEITLPDAIGHVAAIAASTTANLDFWELA